MARGNVASRVVITVAYGIVRALAVAMYTMTFLYLFCVGMGMPVQDFHRSLRVLIVALAVCVVMPYIVHACRWAKEEIHGEHDEVQ